MITRAYQPNTLVGPPVRRLVLDPLAVYSSRTVYISVVIKNTQKVVTWKEKPWEIFGVFPYVTALPCVYIVTC